jgi:hypothetical protein
VALENYTSAYTEFLIANVCYMIKPSGPGWVEKFRTLGKILLRAIVMELGDGL